MRGFSSFAFVSLLLFVAACAPAGSSAYVTFNLPPDSNCEVAPPGGTTAKFVPVGSFDISGKAGSYCDVSYYVNLLVNSNLRSNKQAALGRAEPNVLQIHSAQVRLMDITKATIAFDRVKPTLPNPFLVTANNTLPPASGDPSQGIAVVEAIPQPYAHQLNKFAGTQILAEIQLFGTTLGDVDIDFKPFVYPIKLCDGCLKLCLMRDVVGTSRTPADVYGMQCDDNAAADGRVCIDPSC